MSNKTKLIWVTPEAEKLIAYCARVSSPNQENEEYLKLLRYCYKHNHWSIFEMASMCIEINTTRGISPQILRHRSFSFQEFSQRYAEVGEWPFEDINPRSQDYKNRQNSFDDLNTAQKQMFQDYMAQIDELSIRAYQDCINHGIAKESARFLLPLNTETRLYMSGTIRSWIHFVKVRTDPSTQKEHRDIAEQILETHIKEQLPIIYKLIKDETI